jgi:hypothetical protein
MRPQARSYMPYQSFPRVFTKVSLWRQQRLGLVQYFAKMRLGFGFE